MLLQSTNGEVFQGMDDTTGPDFSELPASRAILVKQFKELRTKDDCITFEIEIRRFYKGSLNYISDDSVHPINIFSKEDLMSNSMSLIEASNKAGADGVKITYKDLCRKMLERAIRVAESQNEFQAQVVISDFLESLGLGGSKASAVIAPVDGKTVTLTKDANVTDRLWSMILGKVDKLGSITESKKDTAKLILKKGKDTEAFLKSVSTIKGIKVS